MASSTSDIALQAAYTGNLSLLKKMTTNVDLREAKDVKGNTVLHVAASKGFLEICRFLVEESRIDVNTWSKTGEMPMSYAALEGNVKVMTYLLDHGADPEMPLETGSTPLHNAAEEGHCETVRLLLSEGVLVDPIDHRGAPLHVALAKARVEVVKLLLEHGADPNKLVNHILTPLMAVMGKSLECMKLLIQAGADMNAHGNSVPTPLSQAVDDGFTDFVNFLLEAEANPNIPNEHGAIPVEVAAFHGRRDLVEVLFSRTKQIPSMPDWSVDGIIRILNPPHINPLQISVVMVVWVLPPAKFANLTRLWTKQHIILMPMFLWKNDLLVGRQGKEAFAKEEYLIAMSFYEKVLDIHPFDATMYANQSLCWLRMRHGDLALEETRKCRMMLPRWFKAWYRDGAALSFMKGAADAFREALQLEPKSKEIKEALRKAEKAAEDP